VKKVVTSLRMLTALGVAIVASGCAAENQTRLEASSRSLAIVEGFADIDLVTLPEEQRSSLMGHLSVVLGEKAQLPPLITKLSDLDQKAGAWTTFPSISLHLPASVAASPPGLK